MANKHRGEVALQAGEKTYTIHFSTNALCNLEEALGMSVSQLSEEFASQAVGFRELRKILWAGMRDNHPDLDLEAIGEIIDAAGFTVSMEIVLKAFVAAFPEPGNNSHSNSKKKLNATMTSGIGNIS